MNEVVFKTLKEKDFIIKNSSLNPPFSELILQ